MAEQAKAAETEKHLAVQKAQALMVAELQKRESEIQTMKGRLETQIQAAQLQETMQREQYETALRLKNEESQRIRDCKAKQSTKALGESLEQYCQNVYIACR